MKPETWVGGGSGHMIQGLPFLFSFHHISTSKNFEEEKSHLTKSRDYCQRGPSWMASVLEASQESMSWSSRL